MNIAPGTVVRALISGRAMEVRITEVLDMTPPRFEADKVVVDKDGDWKYPEKTDHFWGYISDILTIIKE